MLRDTLKECGKSNLVFFFAVRTAFEVFEWRPRIAKERMAKHKSALALTWIIFFPLYFKLGGQ
jgi:hypothetical protein